MLDMLRSSELMDLENGTETRFRVKIGDVAPTTSPIALAAIRKYCEVLHTPPPAPFIHAGVPSSDT